MIFLRSLQSFNKKPKHKYPTKFSKTAIPQNHSLPKLWNDFLQNEKKEIQSDSLFQKTDKSKLIETENFNSYSLNTDQSKF